MARFAQLLPRLLAASVLAALAVPAVASGQLRAPLVPRELASLAGHPHALIQLEHGAPAAARARLRAAGGQLISPTLRVWRVPSARASQLVPKLAVDGTLREFQPDRPQRLLDHITKGDPLLAEQWWLAPIGADGAEPPGPGTPVTVVDSGVDVSHPEFAGRPNTVALNPQTTAGRREFHGTAVASLIAAPANGIGLVGVYPQAVLYAWDASPDGVLRSSDVIEGIEAAMAIGPGIVNLSLGGEDLDPIESDAVLTAFERGVIVVAAAGNERDRGSPTVFPASLPHVFTVASVSPGDGVSQFSSVSPAIDIAAPGDVMTAAVPASLRPEGYSPGLGGTSFAAPLVAAAAAWVWTARPTLEKTQLVELLRRTARDVGVPGRDSDTGFGVVDIPTALTAPAPPIDPQEPNDDVDHVRAGQLFAAAKPSLTSAGRARATVAARLDLHEDRFDVYRAWIPAGRRLTVALHATGDADLQLWSATSRSIFEAGVERRRHLLAQSARRGTGEEAAAATNARRAGVFVYVTVVLRPNGGAVDASYRLSLATARVRR